MYSDRGRNGMYTYDAWII